MAEGCLVGRWDFKVALTVYGMESAHLELKGNKAEVVAMGLLEKLGLRDFCGGAAEHAGCGCLGGDEEVELSDDFNSAIDPDVPEGCCAVVGVCSCKGDELIGGSFAGCCIGRE